MKANENKVLIVVKGGIVQSIYSNNPDLKYELLDFDNEELETADEEEKLLHIKAKDLESVL